MAGNKKQRSQGQPANAQRPLISVCMIVKDEEANLDRCLRSVRPIADEIVVVDTGSRDSTVEIARRYGAKVSHFEWCDDFAAARNAALKQATGRWVLQMDADEELAVEATRSIRRIVGSAPPQCWGYFIRVRCYGLRDGCETHTVIYRPLLFRNHRELRYKARIHEYIEYFGSGPKPEFCYHDDLAIEHHGYMPDQQALKDKAERNLRLLRQAAAEEPDEPYHQFNLGLEYYSNGRFAEAVEPLQRAVALCRNPSQNYLPNAYTMLVVSLSRVGRSSEVPTMIAEAEQRLRTLTADFYCNAGEALRIAGQLDEALSYFQRAIDIGEVRVAAPFDPGAHTWLPRSGMGMIYDQRGQLELALAFYEKTLSYVPQHPAINGRLAAVAARLGYPERALHHVGRVLKLGDVPEEVWRDLLETCELLPDAVAVGKEQLTDPKDVIVDLLLRMPLRSDLGARIASACLRFGQYERGIAAATAALEQGEDLMSRVNRGLCYFSLGRFEEATDDFTAALAAEPGNADVLSKLGLAQHGPEQTQADQDSRPDRDLGKKPNIICVMRVRNAERWIAPALAAASQLVDGFVILDDNSSDRTAELCRAFPKVRRYELQRDAGTDEARGKDKLWQWALEEHPDWILALDGDELLEDVAAIAICKELAVCSADVSALGFNVLYMWGTHDRYRVDGRYGDVRQPRLFRITGSAIDPGSLSFCDAIQDRSQNCGSIPVGLPGAVLYIDVNVKSYRYFQMAEQEAKEDANEPDDPFSAGASDSHVGERGIVLFPWHERDASEVFYSDASPDVMIKSLREHNNPLWQSALFYLPGCRSHLDIGSNIGDTLRGLDPKTITCVEKYAPAAAKLREVYANVIEGDAREVVESLARKGKQFDRVTMIDFIEHLPRSDAEKVLDSVDRLATREIALFVPMESNEVVQLPEHKGYVQDYLSRVPSDQRELYRHLSYWTPSDFTQRGYQVFVFEDFHCEGFSAFFAVKYLSTTRRELAMLRWQNYVGKKQEPPAHTSMGIQPAAEAIGASGAGGKASPTASIIVAVFNNIEYTKRCLEAIIENTPEELYEVVIVDNASTDGTKDFLNLLVGDVKVIANETNLGFTEACNQGAQAAIGKYLVFLNNDTQPQSGWLENMIALAERDPTVGAVGAKLVYPDGTLQEAGGIIFSDGNGWNYGRGMRPSDPRFNFVREVDYCSGAALLVRSDLWKSVGGFDLRYAPAYYEDTDLCFAIRRAGYRVLYQPAAVVIHYEGATAGTNLSVGTKKYQAINRTKFVGKWSEELAKQWPPASIALAGT